MIADSTLRELGAEKRGFRSVKGALLWYVNQLLARLRVNRDYEWGSTPRCEQARQIANATFAAVAQCVRSQHPTDTELVLGEHLLYLVAWYETTEGDGQYLADQANMDRWAFVKRCRKTERTLRKRLESAGLLEER